MWEFCHAAAEIHFPFSTSTFQCPISMFQISWNQGPNLAIKAASSSLCLLTGWAFCSSALCVLMLCCLEIQKAQLFFSNNANLSRHKCLKSKAGRRIKGNQMFCVCLLINWTQALINQTLIDTRYVCFRSFEEGQIQLIIHNNTELLKFAVLSCIYTQRSAILDLSPFRSIGTQQAKLARLNIVNSLMLQFDSRFNVIFLYALTHCAYDLVRFRHKNIFGLGLGKHHVLS